MNPIVSDLRHLKMAELYELAFERFVRDLALRTIQDGDLRARILELVPEDDPHAGRIQAEIRRLNERITDADTEEIERAALLDIIDVEREARKVYLDLIDKAHDRRVVDLFKELAREEAEHARLAERILTEHDSPPRRSRSGTLSTQR